MSAPILFLMRELRRIGIISDSTFDQGCYYINGPVKRVAFALRWIDEQDRKMSDIEGLLDLSASINNSMRIEAPQLSQWFDLPLQMCRQSLGR